MNRNSAVHDSERIAFMDRLRLAFVLMVVFMHSAAAYTNVISWWSVQETPKSRLLDIFVLFVDGFQMPLLFFIAGYFAYHSKKKRAGVEFIKSKLRRIGLPFLAIALFLTPYISYTGIKFFIPETGGFLDFWITQMKTLPDFTPVLFENHEAAHKHMMDYSLWHLWFVMVLLALYFLYAGFCYIKERYRPGGAESRDDKGGSLYAAAIISGIIMIILYSAVNMYAKDWAWGKIGFFSVQPTRLPSYIVIFFLGTFAGSRNWFAGRGIPGKTYVWASAFLILSAALLFCMFRVFITWSDPTPYLFSLLHGFIRTGVVFSASGLFIRIAMNRNEKPSLLDSMSGYSYEIYIIHLPLVIAAAYLMKPAALPLMVKFVLAGCIVTSLSYAAGRYLIRPYPKTACAVIGAIFCALCLVYR